MLMFMQKAHSIHAKINVQHTSSCYCIATVARWLITTVDLSKVSASVHSFTSCMLCTLANKHHRQWLLMASACNTRYKRMSTSTYVSNGLLDSCCQNNVDSPTAHLLHTLLIDVTPLLRDMEWLFLGVLDEWQVDLSDMGVGSHRLLYWLLLIYYDCLAKNTKLHLHKFQLWEFCSFSAIR